MKTSLLFVMTAMLVAACAAASTSTTAPTAMPATATATVAAPTSRPPAATPTLMLPTSTPLPATATNLPPELIAPTAQAENDPEKEVETLMKTHRMELQVGEHVLTATLAENSSADALREALSEGPITLEMRDYEHMEKVGSLGMELPRNDEQITTEAGDLILYQGSALVIYYAPNAWNFTRLGKIQGVTAEELKAILGAGNVTVTLSLAREQEE